MNAKFFREMADKANKKKKQELRNEARNHVRDTLIPAIEEAAEKGLYSLRVWATPQTKVLVIEMLESRGFKVNRKNMMVIW